MEYLIFSDQDTAIACEAAIFAAIVNHEANSGYSRSNGHVLPKIKGVDKSDVRRMERYDFVTQFVRLADKDNPPAPENREYFLLSPRNKFGDTYDSVLSQFTHTVEQHDPPVRDDEATNGTAREASWAQYLWRHEGWKRRLDVIPDYLA